MGLGHAPTAEHRRAFHNPGWRPGGESPGQISRRERQLVAARDREAARAERMAAGEYLGPDNAVVTNPSLSLLPVEFVEPAVEQLRKAVQIGNFESIHAIADTLASKWANQKHQDAALAARPFGIRLATYLTECRDPQDGERIPVRLINSIESVCPATLGAVLENWPLAFVKLPNVSIKGVEMLGRLLVSAGLMDQEAFDAKVAECREKLHGIKSGIMSRQ